MPTEHSTSNVVRYKSLAFVGYPQHRIGDDGSVWSCAKAWRLGTWRPVRTGMWYNRVVVCLTRKGKDKTFVISNLVLEAFVGPCPPGMECCHFPDPDRRNNRLENLCWDTKQANYQDRVKHGTDATGEKNPKAKLTEDDVRAIRLLYAAGNVSQSQLGRRYGVGQDTISSVVRRETWTHVEP